MISVGIPWKHPRSPGAMAITAPPALSGSITRHPFNRSATRSIGHPVLRGLDPFAQFFVSSQEGISHLAVNGQLASVRSHFGFGVLGTAPPLRKGG